MKKIKLSIAGLLLAGMSYGQTNVVDSIVPMKNGVYLTKHEVWEMMGDLEDILEWQQQDMENGYTNMGSYEEEWGSNYYLTLMLEKLEEIVSRNAENWR
tara:strand:+ start:626 stop:922 length:297 start_codon:yes stop_codon:yes gene_type:complete